LDEIRIAVISDLHVGGARSKDLCPYATAGCEVNGSCPYKTKKCVEADFLDRFEQFANEKDLEADYLLILGDATQAGQPDEVYLVCEVIERLRESLGIASERVAFIPGNHDVDWEVLSILDHSGVRFEQRFEPIAYPKWRLKKWMSRSKPKNWLLTVPPYLTVWQDQSIVMVGYNSAWADRDSADVHHGQVDEKHVEELEKWLNDNQKGHERYWVFLTHYHPIQYDNEFPETPDFSIMNGKVRSLLDLLYHKEFDIFLHGHKHRPFLNAPIMHGHPLLVLGAGSFSAPPDMRWDGRNPNSFHIVTLRGRKPLFDSGECAFGEVRSWAYYRPEGWIPSQRGWGIRFKEPFGTYLSHDDLKRQLCSTIEESVSKSGKAIWSSMVAEEQDFAFVMRDDLDKVLQDLCSEKGWSIMRKDEDFIVLPGKDAERDR